jgi:hypothetical protein
MNNNFGLGTTNFLYPASLNNKAIVYLQHGREHEAIELLEIGLAYLRDQFHTSSTGTLSTSGSSTLEDKMIHCESSTRKNEMEEVLQGVDKPCDPVVWVTGVPLPMETCVERVTGFIEMYDRALLIDAYSNIQQQQHRPKLQEVISAILLYNLGLMHHIRGLHPHGGCVSDKFLADAYHLYEISLSILERNDAADVDPLLYLALLNNMAHIATGLSLTNKLYDELDAMRSIIQRESDFVKDEDLQIFCVNAMCFSSTLVHIAPAA